MHRASELASEIQTTFDDLAPNSMLNLEKLGAMLAGAYRDIAVFLARRGEDVAGTDVGADQEGDAGASKAGAVPGQISSRADVIRSLDAAIAYFRNEEPSSPVPLLLQRAKRLTAMDFLEIIRDMAPEGLDQIRNVGGLDSGDE